MMKTPAKNKKKLEDEKKTVKQLRGFWTKFAQKPRERECAQENKILVENSAIKLGIDSQAENCSDSSASDRVGL